MAADVMATLKSPWLNKCDGDTLARYKCQKDRLASVSLILISGVYLVLIKLGKIISVICISQVRTCVRTHVYVHELESGLESVCVLVDLYVSRSTSTS